MEYEMNYLRKELSESRNIIAELKADLNKKQNVDDLKADLKQNNQMITDLMSQISMDQKTAEKSIF